MLNNSDQRIVDVLLDSWDGNNTILVNVRAVPTGRLEPKVMMSSPSVALLLTKHSVISNCA